MRLSAATSARSEWLEELKANEPKFYEKNTPIVEALAEGEIELGLVNHYYLYLIKEENPDAPVANHFLHGDDPGALVNVAGAGVIESAQARRRREAVRRVPALRERQRFYAEEAEEAEYPLVAGVEPQEGCRRSTSSSRGPGHRALALGAELETTLELLNEAGYTT